MKNDSGLLQRFKFDLIAVTVLLLVGLGVFLHHFPMRFDGDANEGKAMMPPQMGMSDILLVLPSQSSVASDFDGMDFSFAWYNILAQTFGAFDIGLVSEFSDAQVENYSLFVIPAQSIKSFDEKQIALCLSAAEKGKTFLLEMPTPVWEPLSAVKRKINTSATIKRLTEANGSPLAQQAADAMLNAPLDTTIMRIDSLDTDVLKPQDLLLEIDGATAFYHRQVGKGHVFVLAFNLGRAVTALQQGRPGEKFAISVQDEENFPRASDLVLNEKLKSNFVPYADLLKRHVVYSILKFLPLPLLYPFPNASSGALIMTHGENAFGDKSAFFADYEEKFHSTSTFFVNPATTSLAARRALHDRKFEIAAHLRKNPEDAAYIPRGLPFFKPVAHARSLASQRLVLERQLASPVVACKIMNHRIGNDYTEIFRMLSGARCAIDTTYSPDSSDSYGYLFGTGMPFLPLDINGLPFPVYEIPTLFSDALSQKIEGEDIPSKLLSESAQFYHQALVMDFAADTMVNHPNADALSSWLKILEQAPKANHWITTLSSFMTFYSLRRQAHVRSVLNANQLTVTLTLPPASFRYTVAVPSLVDGAQLSHVSLNNQAVNANDIHRDRDSFLTLVTVDAGEHLLTFRWGN